ncbi:uncharacterized protein LOC119075859 isoform X2 [Bradysia coprophila]|uniref:uncharacterized protein LOC119075859 isoform X2 n=1 Tax=Bradysia coprophila TaxID=38358 RepID=UPI00187DD3DB|nr:uncharacterized protein LOC119075859 isoform X2 [Bradysia coprophila]
MNIHCMDTCAILLLAVSLATAQRTWSSMFGYHRNDDYNMPAVIEIPLPKVVRIFDDDYPQPQRRFHSYDPYDQPPPVIYLPRVHVVPDVYVDDLHPYAHRFQEPPYLSRLWTTLSYTYNTRLVRVIDKDETKETVADSVGSASNTVEQPATKGTTKKEKSTEKAGSADKGSVKKVTSKPKAEAVTKSGEKPDDNKTTGSSTKVEGTKVSENNGDGVETKPVEEEIKTDDATSDSTSAPTENGDGSTTDAVVPAD